MMRLKVNFNGERIVKITKDEPKLIDLLNEFKDNEDSLAKIKALRFGFPSMMISVEGNLEKTLDELGLANGDKVFLLGGESDNKPKQVTKKEETRLLAVHEVPDDNSCLFHAISFASKGYTSDQLRELVYHTIKDNPREYTDAILGKPRLEYMKWILDKDSWGGGIEISILSKILQLSIFVVDIDAINIDKFYDTEFDEFIILLFNGVHYNVLTRSSNKVSPIFNMKMESAIMNNECLRIAKELKQEGKSINTHVAKIKCNQCNNTFIGEREVAKHAEKTSHTNFVQL